MPGNPPPPPGFEVDAAPPRPPRLPSTSGRGVPLRSSPVDGDTLRLNARLYGIDAFERDQTVTLPDGTRAPIGRTAQDFMRSRIGPDSRFQFAPGATYGRPVASIYNGEDDVALDLLRNGYAVVEPQYLRGDPERLARYTAAEAEARANRRGAYAGEFVRPSVYRHSNGGGLPAQLAPDPLRVGRQPMNAQQAAQYRSLLLTPGTRPEQLQQFAGANGYTMPNAGPLLSFARRNPGASFDPAFTGTDGTTPEREAARPNLFLRQMSSLNEGIADTLGFPVDAVNGAFRAVGLPTSETPLGGSASIRGGFHYLGIGQLDDSYAPQSRTEQYAQAAARGIGQAAVPTAGMLGAGGRLALRGASAASLASAPRMAVRDLLVSSALNPGVTLAAELGGGVGSQLAGEVAGEVAPGNPYADMGAQLLGGAIGGGVAGLTASRFRPGASAVTAPPPETARPMLARPVPEGVTVEGVLPDGSRFGMRADGSPWAEVVGDASPSAPVAPVAAPEGLGGMDGPANPSAAPDGLPALPDGFQLDGAASMAAEPAPSLAGPMLVGNRQRDVIDVNAGRTQPMGAPITDAQLQAASQRIAPADVMPLPSNTVDRLDEVARAHDGLYRPISPLNERAELSRHSIPSPVNPSIQLPKRGPLDLVTWLRTRGGLQDSGGELRAMGITNRGRVDDFATGEQRFGKLVDQEHGMTLDDAALQAWEAGYFPEFSDRPPVDAFLQALRGTHDGYDRRFHPSDFEEVARFQAARDQRHAVEKANNDGTPLVEQLGEPATLADMEANTPPLSAFDELPGGQPDFAGNVRLSRLDSPQDISRALVVTNDRLGGFDNATRGRITQDETARLASELGMTPDSLIARRRGQAFNAEEALAARQILAKSGNELVNLARRVQSMDNPGDDVLAEFQRAWTRHVAIQEQVSGATAEAGRALAQFRVLADSRNVRGDVLGAMVQSGGGADRLKRAADLILEHSDNPAALNADAVRALRPSWADKLTELWYNSLLSGPQTHVVNVMSNALTSVAQLPEYAAAAAFGGARRLVSSAAIDRVLAQEVGARAVGLVSGVREGIGQFLRTLRTGEGSDAVTKVEARTQTAISGIKGSVIRTPTRLLAAEDELFKAMARRMELHGLALRQASKEGLRGKAATTRAAELVANPTDELLKASFDYGRYLTFQRPLGPVGQSVSRITQDMPALKLVLPFVRTPTNLLKFAIERSPAAPLLREWRADVMAGGARRDLAAARAILGTGLGLAVSQAAADGLITGAPPTDQRRAAMLRANGWQPYSIVWRGQYYSYSRLDPFSTTIGTAADFATRYDGLTESERDDAATTLTASFMAQLGDKTWLSGVSDLVQAINDPDRYMDSFVKRLGGSIAVPALGAQIARTVDPVARSRDTVSDAIQARIPGLSDNLAPQRDVLGREVVNQGGIGPDILSPIWQSSNRNDPVLNELIARRLSFDRPDRTIAGKKLTAPQYDAYQRTTGQIAYPRLQALIAPPQWRGLDHDGQQDAVRDVMRAARAEARGIVLGNQPVLARAPRRGGMVGRGPVSAPPPPPPGFMMDR